MYKVSIFNNGVEIVIHYPSSDQDDPHVNKLPLKEGLSIVDTLSFALSPNNPGYNSLHELTTKIKVYDLRDDTVRFSGRILNVDEKMDSGGQIYKDITCEGALGFLNDTKQRGSSVMVNTVTDFLNQILSNHNSKVEPEKQINIGIVTKISQVIHTYTYLTTLAEILAVRDKIGGEIRIEDIDGSLYLDWVEGYTSNIIEVSLGVNMKDMIISRDTTSIGSRIIPLGANNITIETVNGGYDYIEESNTKALYGSIEKTVEYKDITDPAVLKNTCISDLPKHTQAFYVLKSNALDLSMITGNTAEQFKLGKQLRLVNQYFGIDDIYSILQMDLDLLAPYNPNLTMANRPITLSSTINDLRKSSLQNDGVYNNVQIGRSFGIRVVRSDNNVTTTMNATDGISIKNINKKVFYVDLDGNLVANDITANNMKAVGGTFDDVTANRGQFNDINVDRGTFDDITANRGTFDDMTANRGQFNDMNVDRGIFDDIDVNRGNFNDIITDGGTFNDMTANGGTFTNITAQEMKTSNESVYIILHDQYIDFYEDGEVKMTIGFKDGKRMVEFTADDGSSNSIQSGDSFASLIGNWNIADGTDSFTIDDRNIVSIIEDRIRALVKQESLN